ncbi:hypothetical protein PENTCL1PPCAC_2723 [Pristionchus entomophagus]|uniref:Secreted protein n=1 Tax=Pristionchus entomophagus TaxID=358040 RepID=A0AAV5SIR6_9BILA|nr:hypothetical protein PENTCL1PPCAC_2723 [Pristionchus entomophagus]
MRSLMWREAILSFLLLTLVEYHSECCDVHWLLVEIVQSMALKFILIKIFSELGIPEFFHFRLMYRRSHNFHGEETLHEKDENQPHSAQAIEENEGRRREKR